jgi:hypothetical protein
MNDQAAIYSKTLFQTEHDAREVRIREQSGKNPETRHLTIFPIVSPDCMIVSWQDFCR